MTLLMVMLAVNFTACSDDDEPCPAQHPQVAVCLKNQTNSWRTALSYYATNQLESKGLTYATYVAKDKTQQANQIRMALEAGCQILVVVPEGIGKEALDFAFSAGIPVVMFEDGVTDGYTALVQGDNAAAGKNAAKYVMDGERARGGQEIVLKAVDGVRYTVPCTVHPEQMEDTQIVRFRVGNVYKNCYIGVYFDDERVMHRKRPVMAPGEMEEIKLEKDKLLLHPELKTITIKVEEA